MQTKRARKSITKVEIICEIILLVELSWLADERRDYFLYFSGLLVRIQTVWFPILRRLCNRRREGEMG